MAGEDGIKQVWVAKQTKARILSRRFLPSKGMEQVDFTRKELLRGYP